MNDRFELTDKLINLENARVGIFERSAASSKQVCQETNLCDNLDDSSQSNQLFDFDLAVDSLLKLKYKPDKINFVDHIDVLNVRGRISVNQNETTESVIPETSQVPKECYYSLGQFSSPELENPCLKIRSLIESYITKVANEKGYFMGELQKDYFVCLNKILFLNTLIESGVSEEQESILEVMIKVLKDMTHIQILMQDHRSEEIQFFTRKIDFERVSGLPNYQSSTELCTTSTLVELLSTLDVVMLNEKRFLDNIKQLQHLNSLIAELDDLFSSIKP